MPCNSLVSSLSLSGDYFSQCYLSDIKYPTFPHYLSDDNLLRLLEINRFKELTNLPISHFCQPSCLQPSLSLSFYWILKSVLPLMPWIPAPDYLKGFAAAKIPTFYSISFLHCQFLPSFIGIKVRCDTFHLKQTLPSIIWLTPAPLLVAQLVKNPPAVHETPVQFLGRKIPWRRDRLPTAVFLPGESLRTKEPNGLQCMGLQRVGTWLSN